MKKNIAIMVPKLNGGGAERVASNLTLSLAGKYNVFLIVFDGTKITYPHSGTLIDLETPPISNYLGKVSNIVKRIRKVRKVKKENNIHCTVSLLDGPNLINVLSRRKDKVITSVRIYLSKSENTNSLRSAMVKFVSRLSDTIVALSYAVKKDLVDNFKVEENKIAVIYNSVDGDFLNDISKVTDSISPKDKKYLVTMGRLTDQKGHGHLIRVFSEIAKKYQDINLVILGEGNLRGSMESMIKAYGLEDRVFLPGYVTNPHSIIKNSEFFLFPSLYEGLGNVLLEALACGKTVVSTDCFAGPREILGDIPNRLPDVNLKGIEVTNYGILSTVFKGKSNDSLSPLSNEEQNFQEGIELLLSDHELLKTLNHNSKIKIKEFSPTKIANEWEKLISNLLSNNENK